MNKWLLAGVLAISLSSCLMGEDDNVVVAQNSSSSSATAPGPTTPTLDPALVEQLTGMLPNAQVEDRTLYLNGATSSGLGDSGIAVVLNSMGVTTAQLTVYYGEYEQLVEVARGENEIRIVIYNEGEVVEQINFKVNNTASVVPVRIRLDWEQDLADIDLYVTSPSGEVASFRNMQIADGYLDIDDVDGYGPETFSITAPQAGAYQVAVNYYSTNGQAGAVKANVQISRNEGPWTTLGTTTFAAGSSNGGDVLVPIGTVTP